MSQINEIRQLLIEVNGQLPVFGKRLRALEQRSIRREHLGLPGLELEKEKFSFVRCLPYIKQGVPLDRWSGAEFEADIFRQTAKVRTMGTTDDSAGGYLVPAQAMPEFIEMLRARAVVLKLGARLIPNLIGAPVTFVKQTGGATAYWVGEGEAPTPSDIATGLLKMVPKKVMALTYINNELIRRANPGAEILVRQDFAQQLSLAIDYAAIRGSGSENQPLGIVNTTGINTVTLGTGNGAVPDFTDPFVDMEGELEDNNALQGSLGFLFSPKIRRVLKKQRNPYFSGDTGGEYPFLPLTDKLIAEIIGYSFETSTQLPVNLVTGESSNCTEILFGNWAELLMGQWAGFEIMASNVAGTAFATDQTWVRIIAEVDFALRHPESFCLCNSTKIAAS